MSSSVLSFPMTCRYTGRVERTVEIDVSKKMDLAFFQNVAKQINKLHISIERLRRYELNYNVKELRKQLIYQNKENIVLTIFPQLHTGRLRTNNTLCKGIVILFTYSHKI